MSINYLALTEIDGDSAYQRWDTVCPHGHVIHHERSNVVGDRWHDCTTDCPVCGRDL